MVSVLFSADVPEDEFDEELILTIDTFFEELHWEQANTNPYV